MDSENQFNGSNSLVAFSYVLLQFRFQVNLDNSRDRGPPKTP